MLKNRGKAKGAPGEGALFCVPPQFLRGGGSMFTTVVTSERELRAAGAARKGGTPGEGPPFDPLLRFVSTRGIPRAAARGQGLRPWTPPAFL